jgi:hypothetical protein
MDDVEQLDSISGFAALQVADHVPGDGRKVALLNPLVNDRHLLRRLAHSVLTDIHHNSTSLP